MLKGKVYVFQNYFLYFNFLLNHLKGVKVSHRSKVNIDEAGVFYNLCEKCEYGEKYETKLSNNLLHSLDSLDLKAIYKKSLCAAKYRNDFYLLFFAQIRKKVFKEKYMSKREKETYREKIEINKAIEDELNCLNKDNFISLFDSTEYSNNVPKMNFSALHLERSTDKADKLCVLIVSDDKSTRIIMIGRDNPANRLRKAMSLAINKPELMLKSSILDLSANQFIGVILSGNSNFDSIYESYLIVENKIEQDSLFERRKSNMIDLNNKVNHLVDDLFNKLKE